MKKNTGLTAKKRERTKKIFDIKKISLLMLSTFVTMVYSNANSSKVGIYEEERRKNSYSKTKYSEVKNDADSEMLLTTNLVQQAAFDITGKVVDEKGEPIPGVTVVVQGTSLGAITGLDGDYMITNVPKGAILVFSFIGMTSKQVEVIDSRNINVSMVSDVVGLEEVVAIGYGTTTKRKAVGAISTMKAETLENSPFMSAGESLQGQVPGLIVKNSGGGPGSTPSISIRGGGSPLYVIDGVITAEQDFNAINSDDIESISFLKDASATAVFGSRAGNGIVLVTTKRGEEGKINVNYSYNFQLSQPTVLPEMMNSYDYAKLQNVANVYDGTPLTYTDEQLETIRSHSDLDTYPDNNWPDLTLKNFAPQQRHNLSLTGGDKQTKYFVSLGYVDQGGILKQDVVNYDRFNIRSNVNTTFENIGLEVGINISASIENYEEPSAGMYSIWRAINQNTNPMYRAYNIDGTLAGGGNGDHPIAIISKEAGYNRTRDKFINTQLHAKWNVSGVKGLKLGLMGSYRDGDGWGKLWQKNTPLYMQDGSLMVQPKPYLGVSSYYSKRLYVESSLAYSNTFGKHGIDATFVYNQTTSSSEDMSASRRDYQSGAVDQLFAGPQDGKDNDGNEKEGANAGYVVRVKYDYNYKYIVEFSGRYDAMIISRQIKGGVSFQLVQQPGIFQKRILWMV